MSTGKRLAKRSILGTRVCAVREDGRYYSGVIQATKINAAGTCQNIYSVLFDDNKKSAEFTESDLIGPGFQNVSRIKLKPGQKVFVTYNGREVSGTVVYHRPQIDEVLISVTSQQADENGMVEMKRKIDEVRLLESRKCARLQGQDTDFAKLADIGLTVSENRKRPTSHTIDVPSNYHHQPGTRKRRPSSPDHHNYHYHLHDNIGENVDTMNDCTAALVLMSLSCSPKSPRLPNYVGSDYIGNSWGGPHSWTSSSSGASSWDADKSPPRYQQDGTRQGSCTPPSPSSPQSSIGEHQLSESAPAFIDPNLFLESHDEGIVVDQDANHSINHLTTSGKKTVYKCTWPGCNNKIYTLCESIEKHVREQHLGNSKENDDGEEEFYFAEIEVTVDTLTESFPNMFTSSPPTLSHMDMARPPYEDPAYRKSLQTKISSQPISIPQQTGWFSLGSPIKHSKSKSFSHIPTSPKSPSQKVTKGRSESRKCRKVYGMDNRELWCTQCKWKKACSRFTEQKKNFD